MSKAGTLGLLGQGAVGASYKVSAACPAISVRGGQSVESPGQVAHHACRSAYPGPSGGAHAHGMSDTCYRPADEAIGNGDSKEIGKRSQL